MEEIKEKNSEEEAESEEELLRDSMKRNYEVVDELDGHSGIIVTMLVLDSEQLLFSGATDSEIFVWDISDPYNEILLTQRL